MEDSKNFKVNFIGIGAAKCGTSWIAKCLAEHPQVFIPKNDVQQNGDFARKELLWFKDNIIAYKCQDFKKLFGLLSCYDKKGILPYLKFFEPAKENQVKGEISTVYMYDSSVAFKIKKEFPDVKILAYLRNPIERTYSHYYFNKYTTRVDSSKSFEQAIKRYPAVYINTSLYYKCLKPYFDLFPRKNILVLIYEDIEKDPVKFVQNIYRFLDIDDSFVPPSLNKKINPTIKNKHPYILGLIHPLLVGAHKLGLGFLINKLKGISAIKNTANILKSKENISRPPMKPETRKYLQQVFAEDIKNLEKLIGQDLSFWK